MTNRIVEQLQALLPPVSYDPSGKILLAQMGAEANALQGALDQLEAVEAAIFPQTSGDYISDWERVFDLVPSASESYESRVEAVLVAMADLGGQSIPYFISLAERFGLNVTYDVNRRAVTDLARVGDPAPDGDLLFHWRLNAPLTSYAASRFYEVLQRRKPANTEVTIGYGKTIAESINTSADRIFNLAHYVIPGAINVV
ncbi:putative phage tail protein [Pseudomonas putida]|uniref:putative phage tail protein n=1 Tax=Pseudomonas putida TaxID=303 RepID=UPI004046C3CF